MASPPPCGNLHQPMVRRRAAAIQSCLLITVVCSSLAPVRSIQMPSAVAKPAVLLTGKLTSPAFTDRKSVV